MFIYSINDSNTIITTESWNEKKKWLRISLLPLLVISLSVLVQFLYLHKNDNNLFSIRFSITIDHLILIFITFFSSCCTYYLIISILKIIFKKREYERPFKVAQYLDLASYIMIPITMIIITSLSFLSLTDPKSPLALSPLAPITLALPYLLYLQAIKSISSTYAALNSRNKLLFESKDQLFKATGTHLTPFIGFNYRKNIEWYPNKDNMFHFMISYKSQTRLKLPFILMDTSSFLTHEEFVNYCNNPTQYEQINGQLFLYIASSDIKQKNKIIKNFGFLIGGRLLTNELADFLSSLDNAGLQYTITKPFNKRLRKMSFFKNSNQYL